MPYLILRLLGTALGVLLRRPLRGAAQPDWSLRTEMTVAVLRQAMRYAAAHPQQWRQLESRRSQPIALADQLERRAEQIGDMAAEWFEPHRLRQPQRVLLYLHGGAYLFGSVQGFRPFLSRLAVENGIRVLAVDYRLAPEHRFPAAQQDALAAYQWLLDQGHEPEQIIIAGDSAGGGLSCALLLQLKQLAEPQPRAALLFSPWVHPLATGGSMITNLDYDILEADWLRDAIRLSMGELDADHPLVAPVHADLRALAPMLIIGGEAEIFRDQIIRFAQHLRDAGGEVELELWPQMMHDFQILFPELPQSKSAMARVSQFLAQL
ncbi:MAG TPA: alpha/beta hydrolase [Pseudomonadales bacterium]|jgi:monoterpene epsilon-lactone hydrolase|nr:alpha/beta hydrolase [Pseudomonadales bacterium]